MIKRSLLILIWLLPYLKGSSQKGDSVIEVRLALISRTDSSVLQDLVIGVSFINNTDSDYYLPGPARLDIGLYEDSDTGNKPIKMVPESIQPPIYIKGLSNTEHPVSLHYTRQRLAVKWEQESLFRSTRQADPGALAALKEKETQTPIFIPAHSQVKNIYLYSFAGLINVEGDYVVRFLPQWIDGTDTIKHLGKFIRVDKNAIQSNPVYFSIVNHKP